MTAARYARSGGRRRPWIRVGPSRGRRSRGRRATSPRHRRSTLVPTTASSRTWAPAASRACGPLITGGDSGIGRAVAIAFAREGADVAIAFREQRADADETVRLIQDAGTSALAIQGDSPVEDDCRALVDRVARSSDASMCSSTTPPRRSARKPSTRSRPRSGSEPCGQPDGAILAVPRGGRAHGARSLDHQRRLHPGVQAIGTPTRIRDDQGRARHLLARRLPSSSAGRASGSTSWRPDPVWTPLVAATTDPQELTTFGGWDAARATGAAGRVGGSLRVPRLLGGKLRDGRGPRGHRWRDLRLRWRPLWADQAYSALAAPFAAPFAADAFCSGPAKDHLDVADLVTTDANRWSASGEPTLYLAGDAGTALAEVGRHWEPESDQICLWRVRLELPAAVDLVARRSGRRSASQTTQEGSSIGIAAESWRAVFARARSADSSCRRWQYSTRPIDGTRSSSWMMRPRSSRWSTSRDRRSGSSVRHDPPRQGHDWIVRCLTLPFGRMSSRPTRRTSRQHPRRRTTPAQRPGVTRGPGWPWEWSSSSSSCWRCSWPSRSSSRVEPRLTQPAGARVCCRVSETPRATSDTGRNAPSVHSPRPTGRPSGHRGPGPTEEARRQFVVAAPSVWPKPGFRGKACISERRVTRSGTSANVRIWSPQAVVRAKRMWHRHRIHCLAGVRPAARPSEVPMSGVPRRGRNDGAWPAPQTHVAV